MHKLPANDDGIREALRVLSGGGVVAHATETCYGLACDLTNVAAVEKLFAIKRRPHDQPVSVLFPSIEEAKKSVVWNARAEELAREHLPGPLTLILPIRENIPTPLFTSLSPPYPTIALRVSSHPIAKMLAQRFNRPLSTTSANIHGEPNAYNIEDIVSAFGTAVTAPDFVLDSGLLPPTPPSTIIDLTKKPPHTIRNGSVCI